MDAATDLFAGEFSKPALDLTYPWRGGWREVHIIMRSSCQPVFYQSRLVSGVVVHDHVDVDALRNMCIDLLQEVQKLRGSVALVAFANHKARSDIESREKRRCAMTHVRVCPALGNTRRHRQDWLLSIKSLYLAFFVDTQHQLPSGRR